MGHSEEKIVEITGLYKKYGKQSAYAVSDITLDCYGGEIVGLIGRNGAGKSTTIKCLTGFLPYEQGTIKICGYDIKTEAVKAKQELGYVPDNRAVFEQMTGTEYVNFIADLHKTPLNVRLERIEEMQEVFRLGEKIDDMISTYSHGMRQKICLMASLIHRPRLWLLDEPLTGLDPQTARALQDYMFRYKALGNAVLYSSHNLDKVEKTCDRVYVIDGGKIAQHIDLDGHREVGLAEKLEELLAGRTEESQ